jgi:hypothetical protein
MGRQEMAPPEQAVVYCLQEIAKVSTASRISKSIETKQINVARHGGTHW